MTPMSGKHLGSPQTSRRGRIPPPADRQETPEEEAELDSTQPLSRTRIINLQRRNTKLSGALVHYLDPDVGTLVTA